MGGGGGTRATTDLAGTSGDSRIRMLRLWPTDLAGARRETADLGRPAVARASGHRGLCAAPGTLSSLWDSDRARAVRRPEGADHAPAAAGHWARLSVDADQPRGRPTRGELDKSAA